MALGDCYSAGGPHSSLGEHPLGLAIDVVPGPGGSWELLAQAAHDFGWREQLRRHGLRVAAAGAVSVHRLERLPRTRRPRARRRPQGARALLLAAQPDAARHTRRDRPDAAGRRRRRATPTRPHPVTRQQGRPMPSRSPTAPSAPVDIDDVTGDPAPDPSATLIAQHADGAPPPGRRAPARGACGLAFDTPGGPVVVVCGLHGGAGTSSLAYALAATAALESRAPVLLCESDDVAGDIAHLTRTTSPLSLGALAAAYAAGAATRRRDARTRRRAARHRRRTPRSRSRCSRPARSPRSCSAASAHHGLTVIDAGTLRAPLEPRAAAGRDARRAGRRSRSPAAARPHARCWPASSCPRSPRRRSSPCEARGRGRDRGVRRAARELRELAEQHCDRVIFTAEHAGAIDLQHDRATRDADRARRRAAAPAARTRS